MPGPAAPAAIPSLASFSNLGAQPSDAGLVAWAFDPIRISGSFQLTAANFYGTVIPVPKAILATNLLLSVPAGNTGAGLANCGLALYSSLLVLPSLSAPPLNLIAQAQASAGVLDISTLLEEVSSTLVCPLTTPQVLEPGFYTAVYWVSSGATMPTLECGDVHGNFVNGGIGNNFGNRFPFQVGAWPGVTLAAPASLLPDGAVASPSVWAGIS